MMMNIFDSFNPMNFLFMNFFLVNYLLIMIFYLLMLNKKFNLIFKVIKNFIFNDFSKINNNNFQLKILIFIFMMNILLNCFNLLPFSFCFNSQLNIFFFISLIMWFSSILFSLMNFSKKFFLHLTPMGCPFLLSPLMVLIEMISLLIRPITLSVRMSANMLAGHLLIHLLTEFSFYLTNLYYFSLILSMIFLMILTMLELGVAMIQPYIFCTLMNMYLCESK